MLKSNVHRVTITGNHLLVRSLRRAGAGLLRPPRRDVDAASQVLEIDERAAAFAEGTVQGGT
jgi:hypothetical protein